MQASPPQQHNYLLIIHILIFLALTSKNVEVDTEY